MYKDYISTKLAEEPTLVEELMDLKGKTLGCWCKPESCHGDVLLDLIEEYSLREHSTKKASQQQEPEPVVGKKKDST